MARNVLINDLEGASDENLLKNRENMLSERAQYAKKVEHIDRLIVLNKKRMGILEQVHKIMEAKNTPLNPNFEFQKDPEFLRLSKELDTIENEAKRQQMLDEMNNLEQQAAGGRREIERFDNAIPLIEEELTKRGVSYE